MCITCSFSHKRICVKSLKTLSPPSSHRNLWPPTFTLAQNLQNVTPAHTNTPKDLFWLTNFNDIVSKSKLILAVSWKKLFLPRSNENWAESYTHSTVLWKFEIWTGTRNGLHVFWASGNTQVRTILVKVCLRCGMFYLKISLVFWAWKLKTRLGDAPWCVLIWKEEPAPPCGVRLAQSVWCGTGNVEARSSPS